MIRAALLKADKKIISCMPKTTVSPNFQACQLEEQSQNDKYYRHITIEKKQLYQENIRRQILTPITFYPISYAKLIN